MTTKKPWEYSASNYHFMNNPSVDVSYPIPVNPPSAEELQRLKDEIAGKESKPETKAE